MKPITKGWVKIIFNICIIGLMVYSIIFVITTVKANKQYKAKIAVLDADIRKEEGKVKAKEDQVLELKEGREKDKAAAAEKIRKMEENQKRELSKIKIERDEWKEKVKELPASEVVVETRIILIQRAKENVTIEIWERPGGILFSLDTAKTNLAVLGDFSLVEEERDRWKDDYFKAMSVIEDKDNTLALDEEIFIGLDDINFNLEGIIKKKDEKFSLSEKRFKARWWKGFKQGVPIGGGVVLLIWLILGK